MQDIKTCDVYNCKLTLFEQRYDSTKYKCLMQTVTDRSPELFSGAAKLRGMAGAAASTAVGEVEGREGRRGGASCRPLGGGKRLGLERSEAA